MVVEWMLRAVQIRGHAFDCGCQLIFLAQRKSSVIFSGFSVFLYLAVI
jgi:hypothetical protein